jgi:branched-chain amino acid transport system permease protein
LSTFVQVLVAGITVGAFYALVALGYTMVYGIVRLINFAHGDVAMVGAYMGWAVLQTDQVQTLGSVGQIAVALAAAIIVCTIITLLLLKVVYTTMIPYPITFMLAALAVGVALREIIRLIFGAHIETYPQYPISSKTLHILGVTVNGMDIVIIVLAGALMGAMLWFTYRTAMGTAMRALAVDHDAARLMGINVSYLIAVAFGLGATLAAFTGVLQGVYYSQIDPNMGILLGLKAFTAAVIGGIGNVAGAMVGGLTIGIIEAMINGYVSGTWSDALIFGILILVLYLRPRGILGERVAVAT